MNPEVKYQSRFNGSVLTYLEPSSSNDILNLVLIACPCICHMSNKQTSLLSRCMPVEST